MTDKAIEALVFDVGNVLISLDYSAVFREWERATHVSGETLRRRFRVTPAFEAYECGRIGADEYVHELNQLLDVRLSTREFLSGWNAIFSDVVEGMHGVLEQYAGELPLYGFSNTNADHVACWSGRFDNLLDHLDTLFVSNTLGMRKPCADSFRHVASLTGHEPERLLFFDDLDENIQGARQAGLQAECFVDAATTRRHIQQYRSSGAHAGPGG